MPVTRKRTDRAALARRIFAEKIEAEFQAIADKSWIQERDARKAGDQRLAEYKSARAHAFEMAVRRVWRELERLENPENPRKFLYLAGE